MKKLNLMNIAAALVVSTLVPQVSFSADADYGDVPALLLGTTDAKAGESTSKFDLLKKAADRKYSEEKEVALRDEVDAKRKQLEQRESQIEQIGQFIPNELKKREEKSQAALAAAKNVVATPVQAVQGQDVDNSRDQEACKVDRSAVKAGSDQIMSAPFNMVAQRASDFFAKDSEKKGEEALQELMKLIAAADAKAKADAKKKNAEEEDEIADSESFPALEKLKKLNSAQSDKLQDARRMGRLADKKAQLEKDTESADVKMNKALQQFVIKAQELKKEDRKTEAKVAEFRDPAVDSLEQHRQVLYNALVKADNEQYSKCKALAEKVGRDEPTRRGTWIQRAFESVAALNPLRAPSFRQELAQEARPNQCRKSTAEIDAALGSTAQARIQALKQVVDPQVLLASFAAERNTLAAAAAQSTRSSKANVQSCNNLATIAKKADKFVKSNTEALAQQAQATAQAALPTTVRGAVPQAGAAGVHSVAPRL